MSEFSEAASSTPTAAAAPKHPVTAQTREALQTKLNEGLNGSPDTLSQDEIKKLLTKTKDAVETGISSLKAQVDALKQQRQK